MICPKCNAVIDDGSVFCGVCGSNIGQPAYTAAPTSTVTTTQGVEFDFSNNGAVAVSAKKPMYQYKVLSQKDKWFSSKFDPTMLEQAINSYAQQGWRVIGCATADIAGFGAGRQEFITLLEREV